MADYVVSRNDLASGNVYPMKLDIGNNKITIQNSQATAENSEAGTDTATSAHYRPGYGTNLPPPSSPEILDFSETNTILGNLTEEQFRQKFAETILVMDDLGLNRSKGESRSQAYLDMVTWDDKYRKSWENDNSVNSSSCGMFVRNTWWLCGARGAQLFDEAYNGGVLTKLIEYDTRARKRWGTEFNAKTFFPKVGDAIYLYSATTNSQHIFTICGLDKTIVMENGESTVYNADGSLASEITFTSVDGGQEDGVGPDGNGTSKTWGCQAIKKCERKMKLNNGKFMNIGNAWPFPNGTTGRPINTWLDIWAAHDRFTGKYVQPIRDGIASQAPASMNFERNGVTASKSFGGDSPAEDTNKNSESDDFYSWPTLSDPLPQEIVDRVKANRDALSSNLVKFKDQFKNGKPSGYTYYGKSEKPNPIYDEKYKSSWPKDWPRDTETEERVKVLLDRFWIERSDEGGASAIMTGDGALVTWGSGIGFTGPFKSSLKNWFARNDSARKGLLDYGITVTNSDVFMIIDTDNNTILKDTDAANYINGRDTGTYPTKQILLTAFVRVTEQFLADATKVQWDNLLLKFFFKFNGQDTFNNSILKNWRPEATCYVVHCSMWGKFSTMGGWNYFTDTNGDLKKILRKEVNGTGFFHDKGTYKLVPTTWPGGAVPSTTMISGMGHKILMEEKHVVPIASLDEARSGDIVFEMSSYISKDKYLVLRSEGGTTDPKEDMNNYIASKQGLSMPDLLAAFSKVRTGQGYSKLQEMRDWYANPSNPKREAWGLRPRIAMDAILHKDEGPTAGWILSDCERANISPTNSADQYDLIKSTIGMA